MEGEETHGEETNENRFVKLLSELLRNFELFLESKKGTDFSGFGEEMTTMDFLQRIIKLNRPDDFHESRACNKHINPDLVEKIFGEILLEDLLCIPRNFGNKNLMMYQILSIYLILYGKRSTYIGTELTLKRDVLKDGTARSVHLIGPKQIKLFPSQGEEYHKKQIILNLPPGLGKTITSILTASIAMVDQEFISGKMQEMSWIKDYRFVIPGIDCLPHGYEKENVSIVRVAVIACNTNTLFSQWCGIFHKNSEAIKTFIQQFIFAKYKVTVNVKVNLIQCESVTRKTKTLNQYDPINGSKYESGGEIEITFVLATNTSFLKFIEGGGNKGFYSEAELEEEEAAPSSSKKQKKEDGSVSIGKKKVFPTVLLLDEPQNWVNRFFEACAPLILLTCATPRELVDNSNWIGRSLRNNTPVNPQRFSNIHQGISYERCLTGYLMSSCLFGIEALNLACFEAAASGQLPRSIIIYRFDIVRKSVAIQEPIFRANDRKYAENLNLYLVYSSKDYGFPITLDKNIVSFSMYCVGCCNLSTVDSTRRMMICKNCCNCGICPKCFNSNPIFACCFECCFCQLNGMENVFRSKLPENYKIPEAEEVIINPPGMSYDYDLDYNYQLLTDLSSDSAKGIDTRFSFSSKGSRILKEQEIIMDLKKNLGQVKDSVAFGELKVFLALCFLAKANYRHVVVISNDANFFDWRFLEFTPFHRKILSFYGRNQNSLNEFHNVDGSTFCLLHFISKNENDIIGLDLQNADAVIYVGRYCNESTMHQIYGRLMRLGMSSKPKFILDFTVENMDYSTLTGYKFY